MLLNSNELEKHLNNKLHSLYIIYGEELLLIQESINMIRKTAFALGYTNREIFVVDLNFNWSTLYNFAKSISIFSNKKFIELHVFINKLKYKDKLSLKTFVYKIFNEKTVIVVINLLKIDIYTQKSAWFTSLIRVGISVYINTIEHSYLPSWISKRLAQQKQFIPKGELGKCILEYIIQHVEGNLIAAHQEILKIGLLYPPGEISYDRIRNSIIDSARYDVFKFGKILLVGDRKNIIRILYILRNMNEEPSVILWVIVKEIKILIQIKNSIIAGHSLSKIIKDHYINSMLHEHVLYKIIQKLELSNLENLLIKAAHLDKQIKGIFQNQSQFIIPDLLWQGLLDIAINVVNIINIKSS